MAVARTSVSSAMASGTAGITATFGTGAAAGNFGLLIIESANETPTTPTGWTSLGLTGNTFGTPGATGASGLYVFKKQSITSGDISGGIAVADTGDHTNAILLTYSGVDATTPIFYTTSVNSISAAATSFASFHIPLATGVGSGMMLVAITGTDRDSGTAATLSGAGFPSAVPTTATLAANFSSASGFGGGIIVYDSPQTGTQTGDIEFDLTLTSTALNNVVLALQPPSSGTTVALTGQSLTGAAGSLLAAAALALSGQALTTSQGSVLQGAPITGQSVTVAPGSVSPNVTIALTGQSLSVGQGIVLQGAPITGQSASVAEGTAAPDTSVALTGQSLSVARGVVAPASAPPLSGQSLTAAQGSVSPAPSLGLSGQPVSAARGSVGPATSPVLSGQATTVAQGSTAPAVSVGISGQSLAAGRGTVTVGSSNVTAALTGLSISVASGALAPSTNLTLVGQSLTVASGAVIPSISLSLVGQTLAVSQGAMIVPVGGHIKVNLGSFVAKPVKFWSGTGWVTKPLKRWTGTGWQETSY